MRSEELAGERVVLTQADEYMGPAIDELFAAEGADVIRQTGAIASVEQANDLIADAGDIDILVANLALGPQSARIADIDDGEWQALFDTLVHPLMWLVRAAAPAMQARKRGKIVAVTSAAPLKGLPGSSAYCAARGAQNAFVRAAGLELAPDNVQFNGIGQNYVNNPTYYPDDLLETERFQKHLARNVPLGRVAEGRETAELALFLASDRSDFIVGQVVPFAGGWVTSV